MDPRCSLPSTRSGARMTSDAVIPGPLIVIPGALSVIPGHLIVIPGYDRGSMPCFS